MKNTVVFQEGDGIGNDRKFLLDTRSSGKIVFGLDGSPRFQSSGGAYTTFQNLPAAALAAGKDDLLITLGTGTEVIARSATSGGVNVKTQVTSPADNDNALLIPVAANGMFAPLSAAAQPRFRCGVKLTQITELQFGAGLDENITSPIGSATAGDGAQFIFDPTNELTLGAAANWIAAMKVAGADTYVNTAIPVVAGRYYELEVVYGADRIPKFYIDGVLVATGAAAGTANAQIGAVIGVQISGTPSGQKDFDCVFVEVQRNIG